MFLSNQKYLQEIFNDLNYLKVFNEERVQWCLLLSLLRRSHFVLD